MSSGNDDNNRTIPSLVNGAIHHKKKNYREFEKYSKTESGSHRDDKASQSHHNEDSRYFSRKSESYSGRYSSHRESNNSKYVSSKSGSDTRVVIRPSSQSETSSSKYVSSWSNPYNKDKINSSQRTSYDRDIQSYAKLQRSRSKSSEKGQPDLMDLAISSTSSRDKASFTRISQDKEKPTNFKSNSESSMEESVDREIEKAKMQKAKRNELRRARRRWRKMNCESSKQSSSELDNSGQEKHSDSERDEKSGSEPAQKLKKSENIDERKCDKDSRTSTEKTDMKSERIVINTSQASSELHSKRQSRSPARSTRHSPQKSFHRSPSKSDSTCSSPLKIDHRSPRRSDSSSSSPQKSVRHSPYKSNRRSPYKSDTHRTDKNIHSTPKSDQSSKKVIPFLEDKNDTTIEEGELKSSESCLSDDCQSQSVSNHVKESIGAESDKVKDLQKENSELKTTISELTFELETKGKALERFSQDYDFKIENLQETYSEEIESLKEEISYLKRDSDREREITDKAKAKEKDLQNKVGRLEDGLLHSGKENLELHEKIKKLEEENSTLRLYNNYPNPYTPQTRTDYGYPQVWK
ncbi:hypothetical protein SNE40_009157 [Patella caerulea]|uniref:Uncharacterized protein n=1 Tax=Patella caerulea TaxID=87958 RepID=A0AAN8JXQ2_PATCE